MITIFSAILQFGGHFENARTDIFFTFISLYYLNTIVSEIIMLSEFCMTKNIQIIIYYLRYMVKIQNGHQWTKMAAKKMPNTFFLNNMTYFYQKKWHWQKSTKCFTHWHNSKYYIYIYIVTYPEFVSTNPERSHAVSLESQSQPRSQCHLQIS